MDRASLPSEPDDTLRPPRGGERGRVLIGADVGASTIAGGLVTEAGEVVAFECVPTHGRGPGTAVAVLLELIEALLLDAGREGWSAAGVGIGLPGIVDADRGMMVGNENYVSEFTGVPLASDLRGTTGLPVFVDNDANALGLGEFEFGVGRGAGSMVLLAIGTGVGGAIVLGGQLVRGHSSCAGEFGHVSISDHGLPCVCGGRGCLDQYVGGEALARTARESVARGELTKVLALAGGDPLRITASMIFEAATLGDGVAGTIVERACAALGAGIGGIVNVLNPELVVVTGGVAASLVSLEESIAVSTARHALPRALNSTRVRIVPADKRRTILGGAALALCGLKGGPPPVGSGWPTIGREDTTRRR